MLSLSKHERHTEYDFLRIHHIYIGIKNIYERFVWFDEKVEAKAYPNAIAFADKFEVSIEMAQR